MPQNDRDDTIGVRYFLRIPNVGDLVNPLVVAILAERGVRWVRAGSSESHLLAIGSIMAGATPASQVWGTGVMHPDLGIGKADADNIHAVRGPLSHAALREGGLPVRDVPLGDPGYLAPGLLGIRRSAAPGFRLGLVCHYVDRRHPAVRHLRSDPDVFDLNVHAPPDVVLRQMAECASVASTSLHGLIFAEAMGIPNLWIKVSDDIAGDGFKFHDWFATTRRPQAAPHIVSNDDTPKTLAARSRLHESTIDADALASAFPHHRLREMQGSGKPKRLSVIHCRSRPTPVFVISFNRGGMLRRLVKSLHGLTRPTEIVVHDNGSTDPATLGILDGLEAQSIRVFRHPPIGSADDLNLVDRTVQAYFSDWAEPGRYVVTDCDIDVSVAAPALLDVYDELLNSNRHVDCVGPMLRIRDIPRDYPLFARVMNRHIEQFWRHPPVWQETSFGKVAILQCSIDTTFALHRAGEPFRRLKTALRVYEPYEAAHLDWYRTTADADAYSDSSSPMISHWNNRDVFERHRDVALEHDGYYAVKRDEGGELTVYRETIK